jgi:hypothetical protein
LEAIAGIVDPSESYELQVDRRRGEEFTFLLRDDRGLTGALALHIPSSISVFEIDPRDDEPQEGGGVRLYKEWKISSRLAGSGIFKVQNMEGILLRSFCRVAAITAQTSQTSHIGRL